MGTGAPPNLRYLLMLLAAVNLTALAIRMWPWQDVFNLPSNGAAAIDPAVCLAIYLFLLYWIGGSRTVPTRKALSAGTVLGLVAGGMLVAQVLVKTNPVDASNPNPDLLPMELLAGAAGIWAISGLIGSRLAGNVGIGILTGIWSAMVSGLIGSGAVLAQLYNAAPMQSSPDPWKQYQGLAIGNPATQGLLQSLDSATWFLLVGPLLGGAAAWVLAYAVALIRPPQKA